MKSLQNTDHLLQKYKSRHYFVSPQVHLLSSTELPQYSAADQCHPSQHTISSYLFPAFCTLWKKIRAQEITSSQKPTASLLCLLSAYKTVNQYHTHCFPWGYKKAQVLPTEDVMARKNRAGKTDEGERKSKMKLHYLRSDPECCLLTPGNFHYPLCLP